MKFWKWKLWGWLLPWLAKWRIEALERQKESDAREAALAQQRALDAAARQRAEDLAVWERKAREIKEEAARLARRRESDHVSELTRVRAACWPLIEKLTRRTVEGAGRGQKVVAALTVGPEVHLFTEEELMEYADQVGKMMAVDLVAYVRKHRKGGTDGR